jgi:hypothetical protein
MTADPETVNPQDRGGDPPQAVGKVRKVDMREEDL